VAQERVFWPLMKTPILPLRRAYSLFRTCPGPPRGVEHVELVEQMAPWGACAAVAVRKAFHMSITASRNPLGLRGPQPAVERREARRGAIHAPKPDSAAPREVAHDDAVGVPLPDRDFVEAITFGAGVPARRSCSRMYCISSALTVLQSRWTS